MGRAPCCENVGLKKGRWTIEEDEILIKYIQANGEGSWRSLPKNAGLLRCGKSCRLRWINYLRTDLKRGNISPEEKDIIIKLHSSLGNRWSLIAAKLPGRTDNEIKNYWNSHVRTRIHSFKEPITKNNLNINTSAINISQKGSIDRALTMATLEKETLKEKKNPSQEEERGSREGFRVLSPYDNIDNEVLRAIFNEERESGAMSYYYKGSNEERESGVLSSNSEFNDLYFSSSMSSCFDDEWVDWDWEGCEGNNIWKKGLWESEDGGVRKECD